jgi:hypothetical protein
MNPQRISERNGRERVRGPNRLRGQLRIWEKVLEAQFTEKLNV